MVYLGLALALAALVGATWALSGDGEPLELPGPVELVAPAPGATVLRQASIVVDMVAGYEVQISVDGVPLSLDEINISPALARYEWEPGPGKSLEAWTPGRHEVSISWNTATGLPDLGSFEWSFRVQ